MMNKVLLWTLQSSGLLILVFTAYYFLFRNNTSFQLRRGLILITLILCVFAPALEIEVKQDHPALIQRVVESKPVFAQPRVETQITTFQEIAPESNSAIPWMTYTTWVYYTGVALSLLLFLIELSRIYYWKITGQKDTAWHPNVIRHYQVKAPFSFGKQIFLPQQPEYSAEIWTIIHQHEITHTRQKHTLDLVLARIFQALFWYNPIIYLIQKELKIIHEALADQAVLKTTSISRYAEALMQVSLAENQQSLGHSFALLSTLSKRLKMMKTHRTKLRATILSLTILTCLSAGIIGWNGLRGQAFTQDSNEATITNYKDRFANLIPVFIYDKLSEKHQRIFDILEKENLNDTLRFKYFKQAEFKPYFDDFMPGREPLYVAKLTDKDRLDIKEALLKDTARLKLLGFEKTTSGKNKDRSTQFETIVERKLSNSTNYIMIYKYNRTEREYNEDHIFEPNEVDQLPQVVGGISNLAKTIALDISVPAHLDRSKLPETVDFSFVVQGGKSITHLDLLTELKGNKKRTDAYYKFFKEVHDHLRAKVTSLYPWKRGVKDGEEVSVRMKISIPTKYML